MRILVLKTKRFEAMAAAVGMLWAVGLRAELSDLRITEVDPSSGRVEVTHAGATAFTTASSLPLCHRFNYFTSIPANTTFGPGESKVFVVSGLNPTDSDIWLYRDANFLSAASIITGMKYGPAANIGRSALASSVGLWPGGTAFVPVPAAGRTLRAINLAATRTTNWFAGDEDFGSFTPPEIRVTGLTSDPASVFLEFTSPLPASVHRIERRTTFSVLDDWMETPLSVSNTAPGRFNVMIPISTQPHEFFRIKVP